MRIRGLHLFSATGNTHRFCSRYQAEPWTPLNPDSAAIGGTSFTLAAKNIAFIGTRAGQPGSHAASYRFCERLVLNGAHFSVGCGQAGTASVTVTDRWDGWREQLNLYLRFVLRGGVSTHGL